MNIIFNGKSRDIPDGITLQELLDQLQIDSRQVVVERNRRIIPRQKLPETSLQAGDALEVIHFVGGG